MDSRELSAVQRELVMQRRLSPEYKRDEFGHTVRLLASPSADTLQTEPEHGHFHLECTCVESRTLIKDFGVSVAISTFKKILAHKYKTLFANNLISDKITENCYYLF